MRLLAIRHNTLNELRQAEFTPEELAADAVLSLEVRDRYIRQHAATEAGHPAPLPPREPAHRHLQVVI